MKYLWSILFLLFSSAVNTVFAVEPTADKLHVESRDDRVIVRLGNLEVAHYVFRDPVIPRPYFAHVKTPSGIQATRAFPPVAGKDATDHATMHPGIWLAFGDLDGEDFWRNKSSVRHVRFLDSPEVQEGAAAFVEEKQYVAADGDVVCQERFHWRMRQVDHGFLIRWDSTFTADREFYFGDQEEMGLGIRVATPLAEKNGGLLSDSVGRRKAQQIWSHAARWCDYSGTLDEQHVGITLLCHPSNFRNSWMHARDYGFVAANPFGRQAMRKGDASKVVVAPGEKLRLQYGIWIHETPEGKPADCEAMYQRYVRLTK